MKLKETAFGVHVSTASSSTPDFGQDLGQSTNHWMKLEGFPDILNGMVYYKVDDIDKIECVLGKGTRTNTPLDTKAKEKGLSIVLASVFKNIFVNGKELKGEEFIMFITKDEKLYDGNDMENKHFQRRQLKFPQKATYHDRPINESCMNAISKALGCSENGSWIVTDINMEEEKLHLSAVVIDYDEPYDFKSIEERSQRLHNRIVYASGNGKQIETNPIPAEIKSELIIYFGAPGTGKSYAINKVVGGEENPNVIRTTFHPDSDYSSFVGCYKPIEKGNRKQTPIISADDLIEQAKITTGVADQVSFLSEYAESIIPASEAKGITTNKLIWDLFGWHNETYFVSILTTLLEERAKVDNTEITYKFSPQAFTKAYVAAWKEPTNNFYLVIEEINRGNCAQIFGDIFQLLDRDTKTGESSYAISPDNDLQKYLSEVFANADIEDVDIMSGKKMKLPRNLSIYATMNTSDQSLFPIDSAFKRRWDWKYIPINKDEDGHYIECGNECYDWWDFLEKVNPKIESTTGSEDKQIGFWFAKPEGKDGKILAEKFVSKVVFYLWNDVFKDFVTDRGNIFNTADGFLKFRQFFDKDGNADVEILIKFLDNLGVLKVLKSSTNTQKEVQISSIDDSEQEDLLQDNNTEYTFMVNEVGIKMVKDIPIETIKEYMRLNPSKTSDEIISFWSPFNRCSSMSWLIRSKEKFEKMKLKSDRPTYIVCPSDKKTIIVNANGWMHNPNGRDTIQEFIDAVHDSNLGITINEK